MMIQYKLVSLIKSFVSLIIFPLFNSIKVNMEMKGKINFSFMKMII